MKIAIVGTRGIPNNYGGFEQFADILSQGLVERGCDVTVYCSENHSYKEPVYNGVKLIHKYDPENKIGTVGQFIYDLLCVLDVRNRNVDVIYMLGYTSSSIWQRLLYGRRAIVVTNMDGLEWKRSKYSRKVQQFLKYAEKLAVRYSDQLVADSMGIQSYLQNKYEVKSTYLPYGSFVFKEPDENVIKDFGIVAYEYDLLIARFEPENNIEMILNAFSKSDTQRQFLLVGNYKHTEFGRQMFEKFNTDNRIRFMGAIYDQNALNNLRYFSNLYFHGHSVGGTNPSLLEAMGSSALICYHDNEFNKTIIGEDGFAFSDVNALTGMINSCLKARYQGYITHNLQKIADIYNWDNIIEQYEQYFSAIVAGNNLQVDQSQQG
jgi:glycosyltransferase involved in cell wall biosynthesis